MAAHRPVAGGAGHTICACGDIVPTPEFALHARTIGYVVLAERPGRAPVFVSAIFTGGSALEQAQNVQAGSEQRAAKLRVLDPVRYVVGRVAHS